MYIGCGINNISTQLYDRCLANAIMSHSLPPHVQRNPPSIKSNARTKIKASTHSVRRRKVGVDGFSKPRIIEPPETDPQKCSTAGPTSTSLDDTVHYLSPVSPLSARTVNEGDQIYDTSAFMYLLEDFGKGRAYSTTETSSVSCEEMDFQRTLAIVKPEAMKYQEVIQRKILDSGFSVIQARTVHLTPEQVSEIYAQYYGSPVFPFMVVSMSIGPVFVLSLAARNAVAKWREMIGSDKCLHEEWFYKRSMMLKYGIVGTLTNALHAPDSLIEANKQNRYFFHKNVLEPVMTEEAKVTDYCSLYLNPTLLEGLTHLVKTKPVDPVLYLAEWLLKNNPFQPRFPPDIAVTET